MNDDVTKEILHLCKTIARPYGVSAMVHSEDMILRFLLGNPCFPDKKSAISYYFRTGEDSTKNLLLILEELGVSTYPISMLEFASGYGCVSRHLINLSDKINLTSCDIHIEAIAFLKQHIGIKQTMLSVVKPEEFLCDSNFEVVFALSFFSHMPRQTWGRWLEALYDKVKPDGYLLFTTQGMESAHYFGNPTIPSDGFWFKATSEQKDLDVADYGQTICTYEFVNNEVNQRLKTPLAMYKSGYWWGHQDLYVVSKK